MLNCYLLQGDGVFRLHVYDGKSIYVKHLMVAVISQLTTARLKAGHAIAGMNSVYHTAVTENKLGARFLFWFGFLKLFFLSDQFNPVQRKKPHNINHNCLRLHCYRKMVCQTPSSGITAGSVTTYKGQIGTSSQSVCSHPCFRQVSPMSLQSLCAAFWASKGPYNCY